MGLRAGLDRCGKFPSPQGFDPRTVQPVGSRYIYVYIYIILINSVKYTKQRGPSLICNGKFHWMALIKKKSDNVLLTADTAETSYLKNLYMCCVRACFSKHSNKAQRG